LIIGLTGQTGAGKSTVSQILSEKGLFVIDCDKVSRNVTKKGSPLLKKLADAFGCDIILQNGELDRASLAKKAFSSSEKTELLNSITHPAIINEIKKLIDGSEQENIVLDAPTLFESGADKLCDKIICVLADVEVRKKRIAKRDNLNTEQISARISAQKQDSFYSDKSDVVIFNNLDFETLKQNTFNALKQIGV